MPEPRSAWPGLQTAHHTAMPYRCVKTLNLRYFVSFLLNHRRKILVPAQRSYYDDSEPVLMLLADFVGPETESFGSPALDLSSLDSVELIVESNALLHMPDLRNGIPS